MDLEQAVLAAEFPDDASHHELRRAVEALRLAASNNLTASGRRYRKLATRAEAAWKARTGGTRQLELTLSYDYGIGRRGARRG